MRGVLGMNREDFKALARSEGFAEDLQKRVLMRLWVKKLLVDDVSWQYKAFSQASHLRPCVVYFSLWELSQLCYSAELIMLHLMCGAPIRQFTVRW